MLDHFATMARYNAWANTRLLAAARAMGDDYRAETGAFFRTMHGTLNHILVADRIWMHRFTGDGPTYDRLDAEPCATFDELRAARDAEDRRIRTYIGALDEDALGGTFTYSRVSEPGTPITQALAPALAHLFNHQTHHRGQAHTILTTLGHDAPAMDLVFYTREAA